ncbi:MAG: alpha/beta fold hydrolase [Spirosomataceae bacterium]
MKRAFIQTPNGVTLSYLDSQTPGPVVLLSHGLTANAHAFDGLVAAGLTSFCRFISVDLRGRGQSSQPNLGYTMPHHAADIISLMDSLGIEKCYVGGHSFGALLTFYMAFHHPERIDKLIILDAAAKLHPQTKDMLVPALARIGQTFPSFDMYLKKIKQSSYLTFWDDIMTSYYEADVRRNSDGTITQRSQPAHIEEAILKGSFGEPWVEYIEKITHHTILVNGSGEYGLGAALLPKEFALETVRMMKNCVYEEVEGNHQTMLYGPGARQIVEAIRHFVCEDK